MYEDSQASWPCWFFSRSRFDVAIAALGEVVLRWITTSETVVVRRATIPLEGLLVRAKSSGI